MIDYYMRANEPTKKDFYNDRYATTCETWVDDFGTDHKGRQFLILSNTVFYAHGGGQKGDRGTLTLGDAFAHIGIPATVRIIDTRKDNDFVRHILETSLSEDVLNERIVGHQKFKIEIDWNYRYTQMRLHAVAHLTHCFLERVVGKPIEYPTYSELSDGFGVNRYPSANVATREQLEQSIAELNVWTGEAHSIRLYANEDPDFPAWYRWWECADWKIPCGGLHPATTAEIGRVTCDFVIKGSHTTATFRIAD